MLKEALFTVTACPIHFTPFLLSHSTHKVSICTLTHTHSLAILCSGGEQPAVWASFGQWPLGRVPSASTEYAGMEFCILTLRTKSRRRCTHSDGHPLGPTTPWGGRKPEKGKGQAPLTQSEEVTMATVQKGDLACTFVHSCCFSTQLASPTVTMFVFLILQFTKHLNL